jgi:hypothetical protein
VRAAHLGRSVRAAAGVREAALWAVLHQDHDRDGLLFVDGGSVHSRTGDSRGEMGVGS